MVVLVEALLEVRSRTAIEGSVRATEDVGVKSHYDRLKSRRFLLCRIITVNMAFTVHEYIQNEAFSQDGVPMAK